jgi:hypothetical protein
MPRLRQHVAPAELGGEQLDLIDTGRLRQELARLGHQREVGYSDAVTLRTLLRRRTGRGVRELRG